MRELRRVGLDSLASPLGGSAYLRLPVLPPSLRVAQVTDAELSRETSDLWFGAPGWDDPPDDRAPDDDGDGDDG